MEFEKNTQELTIDQLMQLRDACELAINMRARDHEMAIRKAIMNAYNDGFTIHFFDKINNPDAPQFSIINGSYVVNVEG